MRVLFSIATVAEAKKTGLNGPLASRKSISLVAAEGITD